jgi:hypothetical protein
MKHKKMMIMYCRIFIITPERFAVVCFLSFNFLNPYNKKFRGQLFPGNVISGTSSFFQSFSSGGNRHKSEHSEDGMRREQECRRF